MIAWDRISGFDWDGSNAAKKSTDKHDVSQGEAEQVFFNEPLLIAVDVKHSTAEPHIHALGHTDDGRLLHITFTLRTGETKIRVISARDISRREKRYYEQES